MEEQQTPKIIKINLFQVSMTLGTFLGFYIIIAYAVTAMTIKHAALSILSFPMLLGIPIVAFFLIKHFRDHNCQPFFPFPVSWMISIMTFLFATVLSCMAAYLYLRFIDKGALSANLMTRLEVFLQSSESIKATLTDPAQIEQYNSTMDLMRQTITWFCSLPASGVTKQLIQSSLLWGNIISLIIALITAKRIRVK